MELEEKLISELENVFDGLAKPTLEVQKMKVKLPEKPSREDYERLIEEIKNASSHLVGDFHAGEFYKRLKKILDEHGG